MKSSGFLLICYTSLHLLLPIGSDFNIYQNPIMYLNHNWPGIVVIRIDTRPYYLPYRQTIGVKVSAVSVPLRFLMLKRDSVFGFSYIKIYLSFINYEYLHMLM